MSQSIVEKAKANEPGASKFMMHDVKDSEDIIVVDIFKDGVALGQHLGTAAAKHFPKLSKIRFYSLEEKTKVSGWPAPAIQWG